MFLIGKRDLPFGIQWVAGSDWVVLHRDFVHYLATSDDLLINGLLNFYFFTVIAPESFFPTALLNSRFCIRMISQSVNLLITDFVTHLKAGTFAT